LPESAESVCRITCSATEGMRMAEVGEAERFFAFLGWRLRRRRPAPLELPAGRAGLYKSRAIGRRGTRGLFLVWFAKCICIPPRYSPNGSRSSSTGETGRCGCVRRSVSDVPGADGRGRREDGWRRKGASDGEAAPPKPKCGSGRRKPSADHPWQKKAIG
jgi:hypothetical protein